MSKPYQVVGLGGTFDHFHAGHRHFLKYAGRYGLHLHVGITHPQLTKNKPFTQTIESFYDRKVSVAKFCGDHRLSCHVSELTDLYGPTLEESKIEALIVTTETLPGAEKINEMRYQLKLPELPVHICSMLTDETGQEIHSDRIRAGEISREGTVYEQVIKNGVTITQAQRQFFAIPQGEVVSRPAPATGLPICVVGDSSLERFLQQQWQFDLAVYDLHQQRQPVNSAVLENLQPDQQVVNPAGRITSELVAALKQYLPKNTTQTSAPKIFVEGEEDLATVALVLLLPLGSRIYYGQPNSGLIELTVTEEKKDQFTQIFPK